MSILFLDLDGVLCDFTAGAVKHHGLPVNPAETSWNFWTDYGLSDSDFWSPLGEDFWYGLQPTDDMQGILRAVLTFYKPDDVFICSSPCLTQGCSTGKARWVEKHLPDFARRLILTGRKEIFSGKGRVLVDDHDGNCEKWVQMGGDTCLVPRSWNNNRHLQHSAVETVKQRLQRVKSS